MTAGFAPAAWRAANQAAFVAAVTDARALLAAAMTGEAPPVSAAPACDPPPIHAELARRTGLTPFEHWLLLLCAGAEIDADTRALCAAWHGDSARDRPSFALALAAYPEPHWSALAPDALGVDVAPRLKTLKVEEPPKRKAGIKVKTVAELVEKLRNEAGVI